MHGEILKTHREKLGLTLKEVGDVIGVTRSYLCKLESMPEVPTERAQQILDTLFQLGASRGADVSTELGQIAMTRRELEVTS